MCVLRKRKLLKRFLFLFLFLFLFFYFFFSFSFSSYCAFLLLPSPFLSQKGKKEFYNHVNSIFSGGVDDCCDKEFLFQKIDVYDKEFYQELWFFVFCFLFFCFLFFVFCFLFFVFCFLFFVFCFCFCFLFLFLF